MATGFNWEDYSESQIYAMVRIAQKLNGAEKVLDPTSAWKESDYALYNYIAKNIRESKSKGQVYDPYGVGVDLD